MKKLFIILSIAVLFIGSACSQKKGETMTVKNDKALVAYFSATGTTRQVAERLAKVAGADVYEIEPEVAYTDADLNWRDSTSRSSLEMKDHDSRPAIKQKTLDMSAYSVVYIGFPIWWYTAPTIINTFVENNDLRGKTIVFFATSGGSTPQQAKQDFQTRYPSLNIVDAKLLNTASDKDLKDLVDSVKR